MRKLIFAFSSLLFLLLAPLVYAQSNQKNVTLPAGQTVNQAYFAFGNNVDIKGTVNGDLYAAGGNVNISGKVNGDVIVAGGDVNISGQVSQDVRVAGGTVSISGTIGQSVTVLAGNADITSSAKIGGSVVGAVGTINFNGPVNSVVRIAGGNVTVNNHINNDLDVASGSLNLTSNAQVSGNLNYWSDQSVNLDNGAKVSGATNKFSLPNQTVVNSQSFGQFFARLAFFSKLASFITLLILGLILLNYFPRFNEKAFQTITKRSLASFILGLVALIITPIVAVLLIITLVGIPIAFITMFAYIVALYLTRIFAIYWVGVWVMQRLNSKAQEGWVLVVGLVVYTILTLIPLFGGLISLIFTLFGLGAFLLGLQATYIEARKKNIV